VLRSPSSGNDKAESGILSAGSARAAALTLDAMTMTAAMGSKPSACAVQVVGMSHRK
jgi:hypothetical protein